MCTLTSVQDPGWCYMYWFLNFVRVIIDFLIYNPVNVCHEINLFDHEVCPGSWTDFVSEILTKLTFFYTAKSLEVIYSANKSSL